MQRFSVRLRALALTFVAPLVIALSATCNPPCPSDVDGNEVVDFGDVALVLLDFGACPVDPPSISSVTPNYGPTAGGTTITITGTALTDTSAVTVGGNAATSVVVVSDTTVTAVTPPGSVGAANVQVLTPGGTATITGGFAYSIGPWYTVLEQNPDPTVIYDATLRAAITASGLPWRVRDNGTGIEMVLIPFPSYNFYLGRTEVTQAQWVAKMGSNPSFFQSGSSEVPASEVPSRPVEQVSWSEASRFCHDNGLRLPTYVEWEYAHRAGTTTAFHGWAANPNGTNDSNQVGTIAWCYDNSGNQTHPVGGKAANGFGLFDMAANVGEWGQDWIIIQDFFTYATLGGHIGARSDSCRVGSFSCCFGPGYSSNVEGFRVARAP